MTLSKRASSVLNFNGFNNCNYEHHQQHSVSPNLGPQMCQKHSSRCTCCHYDCEGQKRFLNSIVRIYVGGEEFITTRETLHKKHRSNLAKKIEKEDYYNVELGACFFDRNPDVFRSILDYHRYDELHLPGNNCGYDLCRELEFWGIPIERVSKCCIHKVTRGRSEAEVYGNVEYELRNEFEELLIKSFRVKGPERIKLVTYLFLEYPMYSKWALRWSTLFATLIIISTMNVALMSHTLGRENKTEIDNHTIHLMEFINTAKWKKLWETDVAASLYWFDLSLVTLFTLEIIVRCITGPNKLIFFKSWINMIDLATIAMYWCKFTLSLIRRHPSQDEDAGVEIAIFLFTELQFLRMFRILKLARNFTGLRVLLLVLKHSRHELVTLIVFIIVGMFFFSFIIYVVEINQRDTFVNVPVAFWWSIVTMTTVGYGDFYPKGAPGMIVGAFCAVAGMIMSGLSIPILSNNFTIYYSTLQYQLRVQERRITAIKSLKKEFVEVNDNSMIETTWKDELINSKQMKDMANDSTNSEEAAVKTEKNAEDTPLSGIILVGTVEKEDGNKIDIEINETGKKTLEIDDALKSDTDIESDWSDKNHSVSLDDIPDEVIRHDLNDSGHVLNNKNTQYLEVKTNQTCNTMNNNDEALVNGEKWIGTNSTETTNPAR